MPHHFILERFEKVWTNRPRFSFFQGRFYFLKPVAIITGSASCTTPLYLCAFWICSHCENQEFSNAISSRKKPMRVFWTAMVFSKIYVSHLSKSPPGISGEILVAWGIPNTHHWIWIHLKDKTHNMLFLDPMRKNMSPLRFIFPKVYIWWGMY